MPMMSARHLTLIILCNFLLTACSGSNSGDPSVAPEPQFQASVDTLIDINQSPRILSSNPSRALVLNERLLFVADDADGFPGWWLSDGSGAGTHPLFSSVLRRASRSTLYSSLPNGQVYGTVALINIDGNEWWVTDGSEEHSYRVNATLAGNFVKAHLLGNILYVVFEQGVARYHLNDHSIDVLAVDDEWFQLATTSIQDSYHSATQNGLIIDVRNGDKAELWRIVGDQAQSLVSWTLDPAGQNASLSGFSFSDDCALLVYSVDQIEQLEIVDFTQAQRQVLFSAKANQLVYPWRVIDNYAFFEVVDVRTDPWILQQFPNGLKFRSLQVADLSDLESHVLWEQKLIMPNDLPKAFFNNMLGNPQWSVLQTEGTISLFMSSYDNLGTKVLPALDRYAQITTEWLVFEPDEHVLTLQKSWTTEGTFTLDALGGWQAVSGIVTICDAQEQTLTICLATPDIDADYRPATVARQRYHLDGSFMEDAEDISFAEFVALAEQKDNPWLKNYVQGLLANDVPVGLATYWYRTAGPDAGVGNELYRSASVDGSLGLVKDITQTEEQVTLGSYPMSFLAFHDDLLFLAADEDASYFYPFLLSADGSYQKTNWKSPVVINHLSLGPLLVYTEDASLKSTTDASAEAVSLLPDGEVLDWYYNLADSERSLDWLNRKNVMGSYGEYADSGSVYFEARMSDGSTSVRQLWVTDGTLEGTRSTGLELASESEDNFPAIYADGFAYDISCTDAEITDLESLQQTTVNVHTDYCLIAFVMGYTNDRLLVMNRYDDLNMKSLFNIDLPHATLYSLTRDGVREVLVDLPATAMNTHKLDGIIYFRVDKTLWRTDLTPNGTYAIADGFRDIDSMVSIGSQVYFTACDASMSPAANNAECMKLWSFDSSAEQGAIEVQELESLNPDIFASLAEHLDVDRDATWPDSRTESFYIESIYPRLRDIPLLVYQEQLIFPKCQGINDCRLWTSDGKPGSARLLLDIGGDADQQRPEELMLIGDTLYMSSGIADSGRELVKVSLQMHAE